MFSAGTSIGGGGADAIDTSVSKLSAHAANGGIYISESNGLTVENTSASAKRVQPSSGVLLSLVAAQSDLRTLAGNGPILVQLTAGDLVLTDGSAPEDDIAVSAHGSGNVLLETLSGAVTASAEILSGTGHISILSTGAALIDDTVSVTTSGAGSITDLIRRNHHTERG